jgi:hypothetical protein
MAFATLIAKFSPTDLRAMMDGSSHILVSDMDFLETMAAHKCFIVPPWIIRANPSGELARVTRVRYDADGNVDKARVLLAIAKEFARTRKNLRRFGDRFSI